MSIIQTFSEFTGLPPLVVETLFLLLLAIIFTVVVFMVRAILRIRYEMIKMNYTISYIARLLERGYKNRRLYKANIDRESEAIVFEMLQEGKSYDEILKEVRVSKEFVEVIEEVATKKGLLPKKNQ
jgi:cytochrome c-type biogenesis protein CcmH/NrfF